MGCASNRNSDPANPEAPSGLARIDLPAPRHPVTGPRSDRREHPRIRAMGRIGCVETAGDRGLCRVHDLSDGGMMIETSLEMRRGDWARISFDGKQLLNARVTWRQGDRIGIRFAGPIDCCRLVRKLAADQWSGAARRLRLAVAMSAHAKCKFGSFITDVVDISQKGMKIRHYGDLPTGLPIEICLERGISASGIVRWSDDEFVGIELSGIIAVELLASAARLAFSPYSGATQQTLQAKRLVG